LKVLDVAEDRLYATREGVEEQAESNKETQYKMAWGAPVIQDPQLHKDVGFLVDTNA
jgi:hypothetical protein